MDAVFAFIGCLLIVVAFIIFYTTRNTPSGELDLSRPFELEDFGDSDGIYECEDIIVQGGGEVSPNGIIYYPGDETPSLEVRRAIDYLVSEWDYAVEYR